MAMSEKERETGKRLAATFDALPEPGKEFLLGFMEGVAAAKEREREEANDAQDVQES
jgi:hypothetical protein